MKSYLSLILFFPIFVMGAVESNLKNYSNVFPHVTKIERLKIDDPISDNPINRTLLKVLNGKKLMGFVREIITSTGCNSACLPVIYTSFYNSSGQFLKILSKEGLTKIYHKPFTSADYAQLEYLLAMIGSAFLGVKTPRDLTDALSGATLKKFEPYVVKGAAFSTLRIHLYNQHTLKKISKILNKNP